MVFGYVDVVDACSSLSAAAKDGFDDDVAAEFMNALMASFTLSVANCAGDWDAYVFKQGKNVVFSTQCSIAVGGLTM
jgi:hypothetical protein